MSSGQSGRSLVELLAVIAIMGLLTVVSLSGFSYLFRKYVASHTISEANDRLWAVKVLPHPPATNHEPFALDGYGDTSFHGYPTTQYYDTNNILTVEIHDVPYDVCQLIHELVLSRADIVTTINTENVCVEDKAATPNQNILKFSLPQDPCPEECGLNQVKVNDTCVCKEGYSPDSAGQCQPDLCAGKTFDACQTCHTATGELSAKADGEICPGGYCANGTCVPADDKKPCEGKVEGTPCVSNNRSGACVNGYCAITKYLKYDQAVVFCASQGGLPSAEQLRHSLSGSQKAWSTTGCFYKELYTFKTQESCLRNGGSYANFICHLKNYDSTQTSNYCGKVICQDDL